MPPLTLYISDNDLSLWRLSRQQGVQGCGIVLQPNYSRFCELHGLNRRTAFPTLRDVLLRSPSVYRYVQVQPNNHSESIYPDGCISTAF